MKLGSFCVAAAAACLLVGRADAESARSAATARTAASAFRRRPSVHDALHVAAENGDDEIGGVRSLGEQRTQRCAETTRRPFLAFRGGDGPQKDAVSGVVILTLIERAVNKIFKSNGVSFPSQLGGCMVLFAFLLLAQLVSPGLGDTIFDALNPGAGLVSKWLPSLFVPGLAMLPLAPSIGDGGEIAKALSVVVVGFLFTLSTVSFSVLFLRGAQGSIKSGYKPGAVGASGGKVTKPYSPREFRFLVQCSVVSFAVFMATKKLFDGQYSTQAGTVFFTFTTLAGYVWGARLPTDFVKVVHPLITTTGLLWGVMYVVAMLLGTDFKTVLRSYKVGSLDLNKIGAGDLLLFLLGPSVVSFALSMYSRKTLLKNNLPIVLGAGLLSSLGGLFGTAAYVRAIQLGGKLGRSVRLSVLSRNVTTALSMAIASILGGDISIAATAVVFTGIIGATYGRSLLTAMGISDPVTRGLGLGCAAQGLGVSALSVEPDAFPFAAMGMVLTAVMATTLVSIPSVKDKLIKLATGW